MKMSRRYWVVGLVAAVATLGLPSGSGAMRAGSVESRPKTGASTRPPATDLDVLFVSAHPDDEAFILSSFGQWKEYDGLEGGFVTVTRGEGGGNAIGTEEGSALGLIREREEREAIGWALSDDIFYQDKVDFYYNFSAPLTEGVWGRENTLGRVVRIVRATRPEVIITMPMVPTPGNHGHHQYAGWNGVEAFYAAADPQRFPRQITKEGLAPWRASKVFRTSLGVGPTGDTCQGLDSVEPTDHTYSVGGGRFSMVHNMSWSQAEAMAVSAYKSQGWSGSNANALLISGLVAVLCDRFVQVDSRVPFTPGGTEPTALFEGASFPAQGGFALGTEFYLTTDRFWVVGGEPVKVTAHATSPAPSGLKNASVTVEVPEGWALNGDGAIGRLRKGREAKTTFTVTPPENAPQGRALLNATLSAQRGAETLTAHTDKPIEIVPPVRGLAHARPPVDGYHQWTRRIGAPQLDALVKTTHGIGVGESRTIDVDLENFSDSNQSGTVRLEMADGFSAEPASIAFDDLAPGAQKSVAFEVRNTDSSLATGSDGGDYDFTVVTEAGGVAGTNIAALNLVPVTSVPQADSAPTVDGVESLGEYTGPALDLSRVWEGTEPLTPLDASGTAKLSWDQENLYMIVNVRDEQKSRVPPPEDAKRHWRMDSVEVTIDPRADSPDTSSTFKVGLFPATNDPGNGNPPAGYRDADHHQGPISETAPGTRIASTVSNPYVGYTIEMAIPFTDLPARIDPGKMGLNILIYDSDSQDNTGETRLGWSTFGGVQGDPYRWGHAYLEGYQPPATIPLQTPPPILPLDVALSAASPQSILQAARNGVAPGAQAWSKSRVKLLKGPTVTGDMLRVRLRATGKGRAFVFAWTGSAIAGERFVDFKKRPKNKKGQKKTISVPLSTSLGEGSYLLVGWRTKNGSTNVLTHEL